MTSVKARSPIELAHDRIGFFFANHPNRQVNSLDRIKRLHSPRNNVGEYFASTFVLDHDLSRGDLSQGFEYIERLLFSPTNFHDLGEFYVYVEMCVSNRPGLCHFTLHFTLILQSFRQCRKNLKVILSEWRITAHLGAIVSIRTLPSLFLACFIST